MGQLLFKLNQVPEDEAQDVRQLLADNGFSTYETHAGFWGLGVSAIWLTDRAEYPRARALLDEYQARRLEQQRSLCAEREAAGEHIGFWRRAAQSPVRVTAMVVAIGAILVISILPFVALLKQS